MKDRKTYKEHETWGRFYVTLEDNWCLVDTLDGTLLGHSTKDQAEDAARFARSYVRKHGDIDLSSFPYTLEEPLHYDWWDGREPRPWWNGEVPDWVWKQASPASKPPDL